MMERIEKLKEFLSENPEDSFLMHALALEYVKQGDDAEARRLFEQLLEKDEQYIGSYYHLARLLERNNEKEKAIIFYEKGMKMARAANDQHSFNELKAALEELLF
jgi:Tfp pilus assembly protein PilF